MSSALAKGAWVVTGAASGLGHHFVRRLAERGESVSAWDRDPAGLERTRALWSGARLDSRVVDVTDPDAVERAAAAARAELGPLAHLVHCAGVLRMTTVEQMSPADFRLMIEVNYLGSVHVAKALLPHMRDVASTRERSVLVLVSSVAGLRGAPELAGYSASKHAVIGFAQALRDELHGSGIDVRALCPPPIDTPMIQSQARLPPIYRATPTVDTERVVRAALDAVEESGDLVILVDGRSRLMHGAQRIAPRLVDLVVRWTVRGG